MKKYLEELAQILMNNSGGGDQPPYAVAVDALMPEAPPSNTLQIEGLGEMTFPLSPQSMEILLKEAKVAPFGKGLETVVDETVRKAKQIDASKVTLSASFKDAINSAVKTAAEKLKLSDWKIEAHLYKLVVYEEGGFFLPHTDTEKEPGMFASLVVQLPVEGGYTGGTLIVRHACRRMEYFWSRPLPDTKEARAEREKRKSIVGPGGKKIGHRNP